MSRPRKTRSAVHSVVTPQMIETFLRSKQASPIDLTPERLRMQLDAFDRGSLRPLAQSMAQIKELDDLLPVLSFKREVCPAVHGWEILTVDDSPEAARHKEVLEYFYNNVRTVNAVEADERGEMSLLLRQMMHAVGYRYAVHEINWLDTGAGITAEFRYVPLQFFERRTGCLRFCASLADYEGEAMEPERWLVTVGQGIMKACSIAYIYKHGPLRDWLVYCGKHGMPGTAGKTSAQPGSEQWKAMEDAVASFAAEFAAVMSDSDTIEAIDLTAKGNIPHPALVDRMDRMMTILWRGGDLSTMSSTQGEGRGASLMGDEMEVLDAADSMMLSEALRMYVDRPLIRRRFGAAPLAYMSIRTGTKSDTEQDIATDKALFELGVPLSMRDIYERYNRSAPVDGDDTLAQRTSTESDGGGQKTNHNQNAVTTNATSTPATSSKETAANEAQPPTSSYLDHVNRLYNAAIAQDARPLAERLAYIIQHVSDDDLEAEMKTLHEDFPELEEQVLSGTASVDALCDAQSGAMVNGLTGDADHE